MKLTPAHSKEAETMAEKLLIEFIEFEMPLNIQFEYNEPKLEQIKTLLAKSMGWGSWIELIEFVKTPHTPIYADTHPELFELTLKTLSSLVGYDYPHGNFYSMLMNAGVGFSAEKSRALEALKTPWGPIDEQSDIADGITVFSTHSHGGIILSEERRKQVPEHLSNGSAFYEEDCEVNLVYLAFPDIFTDKLGSALSSYQIAIIDSKSIPMTRDLSEKHEAMLKNLLSNTLDFGFDGEMSTKNSYVSPEDDPLNRKCTDEEKEAIDYLAKCVFFNNLPVRIPTDKACPTLDSWVAAFTLCPRIDGKLPMVNKPWKEHFMIPVDNTFYV